MIQFDCSIFAHAVHYAQENIDRETTIDEVKR